jgi:uncharacterized membrane protein YuzA (DUF378 family)
MAPRGPRDQAEARATRRRRWLECAAVVALLVAGAIVLALAGDSTAADAVGYVVFGIAGVVAVALVFYEIGLGEERDRARGWRGPYDRR